MLLSTMVLRKADLKDIQAINTAIIRKKKLNGGKVYWV